MACCGVPVVPSGSFFLSSGCSVALPTAGPTGLPPGGAPGGSGCALDGNFCVGAGPLSGGTTTLLAGGGPGGEALGPVGGTMTFAGGPGGTFWVGTPLSGGTMTLLAGGVPGGEPLGPVGGTMAFAGGPGGGPFRSGGGPFFSSLCGLFLSCSLGWAWASTLVPPRSIGWACARPPAPVARAKAPRKAVKMGRVIVGLEFVLAVVARALGSPGVQVPSLSRQFGAQRRLPAGKGGPAVLLCKPAVRRRGSAARGRLARALNSSKGTPVARALGVAPGYPSFSPRSREWSRRAGRGPISARGACGRRAPGCASPSARRRPCVG